MSFVMKVRGAKPAVFLSDRRCAREDCGHVFEASTATEEAQNSRNVGQCPACGSTESDRIIGTATAPVTIVRGNHDFSERQSERLYKRSSEHFKKEGREEAIERQRAQFKREGLVQ